MAFNLPSLTPKTIPNMIPPSIGNVLGDVIHDAVYGVKKPKSDPIIIPPEEPNVYDNQTPNVPMSETIAGARPGGLSEVYAKIRTEGIVQTNHFAVLLDRLPIGIATGQDDNYTDSDSAFFSSSVEAVQFPGTNLLTTEYRKYGQILKVPYMRDYQEVTITFRCNGAMWERKFFDNWQNIISNNLTMDFKFKEDYVTGILISQLDHAARKVYSQTLYNAFPIAVSTMEGNYADAGNYQRVSVTFAYDFAKQRKSESIDELDSTDALDVSEATPTPNFPESRNTIPGSRKLTPLDRAMGEILKVGKGVINNRIIKNIPIGNIPGIGPLSGLL